jgi:hypothetical protein
MRQAYPQGRPQEDPRVPLPRYVTTTLADATMSLGSTRRNRAVTDQDGYGYEIN